MSEVQAVELRYERSRRMLIVAFDDGSEFELSAEYLRTHSPSAEVRGHGLSEPKLMRGKENVGIAGFTPIGSYAVQIIFDDGHDSGIYSWPFLHDLGSNQERYLSRYAQRLSEQELGPSSG